MLRCSLTGQSRRQASRRRFRIRRCDGSIALLLAYACTACAGEATLARDTLHGGLVIYSFQNESDVLTTSGRREAMALIQQKCLNGSHIQMEGEVPKVSRSADRAWRGQMGGDRQWGIQFTCE